MPKRQLDKKYGSSANTNPGVSLANSSADIRVPDQESLAGFPIVQEDLLVDGINARGKQERLPPMYVEKGKVHLRGVTQIPDEIRMQIDTVLSTYGVETTPVEGLEDVICMPLQVETDDGRVNLAKVIGHITRFKTPKTPKQNEELLVRTAPIDLSVELDFEAINERAKAFVEFLEANRPNIIAVLTQYETHEVAEDEFDRTIDLLSSLDENKDFFNREVGRVAVFSPRNQPLYAFACFGIVPSLMAREVDYRPPVAMQKDDFFGALTAATKSEEHFPNVSISTAKRREFIEKHAAVNTDKHSTPKTDVVIVTGTPETSDKIRQQFPDQVLFITNGAGHNPIVIAEDADIEAAVEGALTVGLYNQGEDCASPDSMLVHASVAEEFTRRLKEELGQVKTGPYSDPEVRVGPLQGSGDLLELHNLVREDVQWLDSQFPGEINIKDCILRPTLIVKPLERGANHTELFGPVFVVQTYEDDKDLKDYFTGPEYARNAMYVTMYGNSNYTREFIANSKLHDETTLVENTHLHAEGVERGVHAYGGFGIGASHLSIGGRQNPQPTLPQRDIDRILVQPNLKK